MFIQTLESYINENSSLPRHQVISLLEYVSKLNYSSLISKKFTQKEINQLKIQLNPVLEETKTGIPLPYITKKAPFMDVDFYIESGVLIPRKETEELVEISLEFLKHNRHISTIYEFGIGSGCIAISILRELELAHLSKNAQNHAANPLKTQTYKYLATDISEKAIQVTLRNTNNLLLNKHNEKYTNWQKPITTAKNNTLSLFLGDIITNKELEAKILDQRPQLIISNPPYIPFSEEENIQKSVKTEPRDALFANTNGFFFVDSLLDIFCRQNINTEDNPMFLFEIHNHPNETIEKHFEERIRKYGLKMEIKKDLSGRNRFLLFNHN